MRPRLGLKFIQSDCVDRATEQFVCARRISHRGQPVISHEVVGIAKQQHISSRVKRAVVAGVRDAAAVIARDHSDAGDVELCNDRGRAVGGPVINDDDLDFGGRLSGERRQLLANVSRLVAGWDHYADTSRVH
jgi:hypothetical protein